MTEHIGLHSDATLNGLAMSDNGTHQTVTLGEAQGVSIGHLQTEALSMDRSAAQSVEAGDVQAHLSALGQVRAAQLDTHVSLLGASQAEHATLQNSAVAALRAETAAVHQSAIWLAQSDEFHADCNTFVGVLVARQVSGPIRPLLDGRGALVFGLAAGLAMTALFWLTGRRS